MKCNKSRALVDIDGVLACHQAMLDGLNADTGLTITYEQWTSYDLPALYGISKDVFFESLLRNDVIRRSAPLPGAREALHHLRKSHEVHIVTHRGWHPDGHAQTQFWLKTHGMTYDTLTVVPFGLKKSDAYRELGGEFDCFFEDNLDNLADAVESGLVRVPVLIDHPWNRQCNGRYLTGAGRFVNLSKAVHWVATRQREPASSVF